MGRVKLDNITAVPIYDVRYYRTNDVQKFRYDRPFHRGQKDPQCEFAVSRDTSSLAGSDPERLKHIYVYFL